MKFELDKNLLKYVIYISITAVTIFVAYNILSNIGTILNWIFGFIISILTLIKPLIIAAIIAYLLYPITQFVEKTLKTNRLYCVKKKSNRRTISIIFSYLLIIGILLGLLCGIYFMIGGQLSKSTTISNIVDYITNYTNSADINNLSIIKDIQNLDIPFLDTLKPYLINALTYIQDTIISNLGTMSSHIMNIGSSIATFFIAVIISIYLLKDSEYFIDLWKKLYFLIFRNGKAGNTITTTFKIIHEVFSKFIKGQLLEAFFVALLSTIALSMVGIDYAVVIGIISGICNLIPYVGPIVGTVLAGVMALLSGNFIKIIYAVVAMIIVQQIDNNFLAPKIVGDSVGLHAVFTMLAILIGGNVGGLFGMLLAVPLAASFKVLFSNWYNNYMNKINSQNE